MLDLQKGLQQRQESPALVLLDSSFSPISYNVEALRILSYPRDPGEIRSLNRHLETQLRSLIVPIRSFPGTAAPAPVFQSGKREYRVRIFTLDNHQNDQNGSSSGNSFYPVHAIWLERQDPKCVDLSTVAAHFRLTPREQETVRFLAEGMTSKEIADRMGISPHTVNAFFRLIMSKMQVCTRSGIVGKIVSTRQ